MSSLPFLSLLEFNAFLLSEFFGFSASFFVFFLTQKAGSSCSLPFVI